MLITVDGGDFSGKSTIASGIASKLRADGHIVRYKRTSLAGGWIERIIERVQAAPGSTNLKAAIFHLAYLADLLASTRGPEIVVLETSWLRVLAYDMTAKRRLGAAFFFLIGPMLPKPDVSFFLDARFSVRRQRFQASADIGNPRDIARFGDARAFHFRLIATYKYFLSKNGAIIVKNNGASAHDCLDAVYRLVSKNVRKSS